MSGSFSLSHIFSKEHHAACKWLGTKDWLSLSVDDDGDIDYCIEENIYISDADQERFSGFDITNAKSLLSTYASSNSACCFFLAMFSKMMSDGPKLYQPTLEHCMAMQHTQCNAEFEHYQQPYPVTMIELPDSYLSHLRKEFGTNDVPRYVFCYRHKDGVITVSAWFGPNNSIVNTIAPSDKFKTIEDAINHNSDLILPPQGVEEKEDDLDYKIADLVQRLALNFSLTLALGNATVLRPLSKMHGKFERAIKNPRANKKKLEKAKEYMIAPVYVVGFNQTTSFYKIENEYSGGNGPSKEHSSPKPHWRAGHYRKQRYGPGNSKVRLKYINPILVMKHLFVGDVSDTTATYKQRGAK